MREEIQLETLAQDRFVDFADLALPGGAGVGDGDVDAAEGGDHLVEGAAHRRRVGHVAGERQRRAADGLGFFLRGLCVEIEQRHLGAGLREGAGGGRADGAASTRDHRDLSGERQRFARAELGQFQRPIFAVEHVDWRDRRKTSDRFGAGDALHRRLRDVGGNPCVLGALAEAEQAEARHQHDARRRIVHGSAVGALAVAGEIGRVAVDEFLHGRAGRARKGVELAGLRRGDDQRPGFGADHMVGRDHAGAGVAGKLLAVDEVEDCSRRVRKSRIGR